ncbi:MAG: hypothetical protein VB061_14695 [Christensenella sp.]|nr:hypothetical protein [Christensenella sp.]
METPMNYALVDEDGVVYNIIWLCGANSSEFLNAVCVFDRPVIIGDRYINGVFMRDGVPVLTSAEQAAGPQETSGT